MPPPRAARRGEPAAIRRPEVMRFRRSALLPPVVAVPGPPSRKRGVRPLPSPPTRVRRIPGPASSSVHPIRLESLASSRGRGHRVVEDHFIKPRPPGPASVHRRWAPRGTSPRRRGDGPQGQARSYAGTAQCPCAEHTGGIPRACPSSSASPRRGPGATPACTCFARGTVRNAELNPGARVKPCAGRSRPSGPGPRRHVPTATRRGPAGGGGTQRPPITSKSS